LSSHPSYRAFRISARFPCHFPLIINLSWILITPSCPNTTPFQPNFQPCLLNRVTMISLSFYHLPSASLPINHPHSQLQRFSSIAILHIHIPPPPAIAFFPPTNFLSSNSQSGLHYLTHIPAWLALPIWPPFCPPIALFAFLGPPFGFMFTIPCCHIKRTERNVRM